MIIWLIASLFFLAGILIGLFLTVNPSQAIVIQQKFYAKINWRIEPISIEKELRNTRLMGITIIIFLLAALFFLFTSGLPICQI